MRQQPDVIQAVGKLPAPRGGDGEEGEGPPHRSGGGGGKVLTQRFPFMARAGPVSIWHENAICPLAYIFLPVPISDQLMP